jgi:hypothetical protein
MGHHGLKLMHLFLTLKIINSFPLECLDELTVKNRESLTLHVVERLESNRISSVICRESFSSLKKPIDCTAYVLMFIEKLKLALNLRTLSGDEINIVDRCKHLATIFWIKEAQFDSIKPQWKLQF